MSKIFVFLGLIASASCFAGQNMELDKADASKPTFLSPHAFFQPNSLQSLKRKAQEDEAAWDEFNHQGHMIWACRRVKSGEFVNLRECDNRKKTDDQWPSKATPGNWRPATTPEE